MEILLETNDEARKDWVAPELKKIDVEAITALSNSGANDGFTVS